MKIINKKIFTNKEFAILNFIIKGYTNKEIANSLNISVSTVKTHVEKMFLKLGVNNRVRLILQVVKNNIIELE